MQHDLKDFDHGPLSEQELLRIRRLLQSDDRARWFWASFRIWLGWLIAAPGALYAAYAAIMRFFGIDAR